MTQDQSPALAAQPMIDRLQAAGWTKTIFIDRDCVGIYRPTDAEVEAIGRHLEDGTRIWIANAVLYFYPPTSTVPYGEAGKQGLHTAACLRITAQERAWFAAHPGACVSCAGRGNTNPRYDYETGVTDCDPCPGCAEKGHCPLCGHYDPEWESGDRDFGTEDGPCGACGWTGERPGDISPAADYECWCGFEEQQDYDDRAAEAARQHYEQRSEVEILTPDYFHQADAAYDAMRERPHGRLKSRF